MKEDSSLISGEKFSALLIETRNLYSDFLEREVIVDVYLPAIAFKKRKMPLLLINDGQDLRRMDFKSIIENLLIADKIIPPVCVGIHCGADRMNEYGTICSADYLGRGAKAGLYNKFILDELLPFLLEEFKITFTEKSFAGFSLGGLSALDIVWNRPLEFTHVGVFSGSLWWRRHGYDDIGYNSDTDRLMHLQVQKGKHLPWLKLFFECGQLDEAADRNNNGIIDSIEDTRDIIKNFKEIGFKNYQIKYLELEDGRHDVETWANAFPAFLTWAWGK